MRIEAILCSDMHLSHQPPLARSAEPSWYDAMARVLTEIRELSKKHNAPVIIAGDVFDRWNSPAELINFAIDEFKKFDVPPYTIPGQHDLPGHNYAEMHRSAYGSLMRAEVIIDLAPDDDASPYIRANHLIGRESNVVLWSYPWGHPVKPLTAERKKLARVEYGWIHLAVVHAYVWTAGCSYPGADDLKLASEVKKSLEGFDAAVFGDNHLGFLSGKLLNSGGLMRRNMDQIEYQPTVGLLYSDGSIGRKALDTSKDLFLENEKYETLKEEDLDFESYIEDLKTMGLSTLDFREELRHRMDKFKCSDEVKAIVNKLIN